MYNTLENFLGNFTGGFLKRIINKRKNPDPVKLDCNPTGS